MDGSSVREGFVSTVCDCSVGLLHLVESKKRIQWTYDSTRLAHVNECVGVRRGPSHLAPYASSNIYTGEKIFSKPI